MTSRQPLATLADLGVTIHRGEHWALDDITTALSDHPSLDAPISPSARAAAARLQQRVAACLPPGLHLVGDTIWGRIDTDVTALAGDAVTWKEQAAFAGLVADTGQWQPPSLDDAPEVRIEGRTDRHTHDGHRVSELADLADVDYWSVYGVSPDGLLDWAADFARLADARHFAARWQRPCHLVMVDLDRQLTSQMSVAPAPATQRDAEPLAAPAEFPQLTHAVGAHR
jgi:hypothetical protein